MGRSVAIGSTPAPRFGDVQISPSLKAVLQNDRRESKGVCGGDNSSAPTADLGTHPAQKHYSVSAGHRFSSIVSRSRSTPLKTDDGSTRLAH